MLWNTCLPACLWSSQEADCVLGSCWHKMNAHRNENSMSCLRKVLTRLWVSDSERKESRRGNFLFLLNLAILRCLSNNDLFLTALLCLYILVPAWTSPPPSLLQTPPKSLSLFSCSQTKTLDKGSAVRKDGGESDVVIRKKGRGVGKGGEKGGLGVRSVQCWISSS